MTNTLRVGIIGDYDPRNTTHTATNAALQHAAGALSLAVDCTWLPTPSLEDDGHVTVLSHFDALWCAPGSPYQSMNGALRAIRFAREQDWPFTGT